jgi:hypothetical protein
MYNKTTEQLVSIFTEDELSAMMTSLSGYINMKTKQKRSTGVEVQLFRKIIDALFLSNQLNSIEVQVHTAGPIGCAEYKAMEAAEYV